MPWSPPPLVHLASMKSLALALLSVARPLRLLLAAVLAYRSAAARSTRRRLRRRRGPEIPRATGADGWVRDALPSASHRVGFLPTWRASILRGSMLDSDRHPSGVSLRARQQLVAFRQRRRPRAGLATLALSACDSTLAPRKNPRDLPLAARRPGGSTSAALRKVRARVPAVRPEYARPLTVWAAHAQALTALYRGVPPPARAKVLAESGASVVFVQPPNASSSVVRVSHATELVGRSRCAMPRVPLSTFLTNETAFESSGSGPSPTFLADETAFESSDSGPLPALLADETAFESSDSGPLPAFLADETAFESSGSGPLPTLLANETAFESSGSGPPPTLGLSSLLESNYLRVATSTLRASRELTRAPKGQLWAPWTHAALPASGMPAALSSVGLSKRASKPLRVPLPQSSPPQRASGVLTVWVSAALPTRRPPARAQRRSEPALLRQIVGMARLRPGRGDQHRARDQRRGPDQHRG
jgi:hypothetical protein